MTANHPVSRCQSCIMYANERTLFRRGWVGDGHRWAVTMATVSIATADNDHLIQPVVPVVTVTHQLLQFSHSLATRLLQSLAIIRSNTRVHRTHIQTTDVLLSQLLFALNTRFLCQTNKTQICTSYNALKRRCPYHNPNPTLPVVRSAYVQTCILL